jgi:hypothetical protein
MAARAGNEHDHCAELIRGELLRWKGQRRLDKAAVFSYGAPHQGNAQALAESRQNGNMPPPASTQE